MQWHAFFTLTAAAFTGVGCCCRWRGGRASECCTFGPGQRCLGHGGYANERIQAAIFNGSPGRQSDSGGAPATAERGASGRSTP